MPTPQQDAQTVTPQGESVRKLPAGVTFRGAATHSDGRGSVVEEFDPRRGRHDDRNIGTGDVVGVNFPTIEYDRASPDKCRLPLDDDYIPHKFDDPRGW